MHVAFYLSIGIIGDVKDSCASPIHFTRISISETKAGNLGYAKSHCLSYPLAFYEVEVHSNSDPYDADATFRYEVLD